MLNQITFYLAIILLIILAIPIVFKRKPDGHIAVIERFEKVNRTSNASMIFILPFIERLFWVNIDVQKMDTEFKALKSRDNKIFNINFQASYQVTSPEKLNVENFKLNDAFRSFILQVLIDFFNNYDFDYINDNKSKVANEIIPVINKNSQQLGIELYEFELTNILFKSSL